jgi:hypothetical protein
MRLLKPSSGRSLLTIDHPGSRDLAVPAAARPSAAALIRPGSCWCHFVKAQRFELSIFYYCVASSRLHFGLCLKLHIIVFCLLDYV